MICCKKKISIEEINMEILKKDIVVRVRKDSEFADEDIIRYYNLFMCLADNDGNLSQESFNKLMNIMGIRISSSIEDRLFSIIDLDYSGNISFYEMMMYFNTITQGNRLEKIRTVHMLVDGERKGYFTHDDLYGMLVDIQKSDLQDTDLDDESAEGLLSFTDSIFKEMGVEKGDKVEMKRFLSVVDSNSLLYNLFSELGSNMSSMLDVQGNNKYTKIFKVLEDLYNIFTHNIKRLSFDQETGSFG